MNGQGPLPLLMPAIGGVYRDVLASLFPFASQFGLVQRPPESPLRSNGEHVLVLLRPYLIAVETVDHWPGTRVPPGTFAQRSIYSLTTESLHILQTSVDSFDDWINPSMPEDLHLEGPGGELVLGTIASEGEAWLELEGEQLARWWQQASSHVIQLFRTDIDWPGRVVPLGVFGTMVNDQDLFRTRLQALAGQMDAAIRPKVCQYLRSASVVLRLHSPRIDVVEQRFEVEAGDDLLSDGTFFWRRDTAEYIETYGIGLPIDVIDHMRSVNWSPRIVDEHEAEEIDDFLWSKYQGWD